MALEYISTSQSTTYNVQSNDELVVLPGVFVTPTGSGIIANVAGANDHISVAVHGGVYGLAGINLWALSSENNYTYINVGETGHIQALNEGISLQDGFDNVVINHGEISAQKAGVYSQGGEISIYNHGSINSFGEDGFGAVYLSASSGGNNVREVVNTGIISGAPQSISSTTYATISNIAGSKFQLDNSGTILGVGSKAIYSAATTNLISNSGLVAGDVYLTGIAAVDNTGTINGTVDMTNASGSFVNSGQITGNLNMGASFDTVINSGQIYGSVYLGNSADMYIGQLDGIVAGDVYGGLGADLLKGSEAVDVFYGGDDLDYLYGRGGDDELHGEGTGDLIFGGRGDDLAFGGSGSDTIHGGDGDDELQGGAKNDKLKGQSGNDLLIGNSGDDDVYGGAGDDILIGGQGADGMNGGTGADTFVFESTADMGLGGDRDSIRGFSVTEDVLDFSQIDWDLQFIGTDSFNGTGDTEVRLKEKSNGNTNVSIDENGDGVTDLEIILFNTLGLTADNFIL